MENEKESKNYPSFTLEEVENAIRTYVGEENCSYDKEEKCLIVWDGFGGRFSEVQVAVVLDEDDGCVYITDNHSTYTSFSIHGVDDLYYACQPLLANLKKKYPHLHAGYEIKARVTSLEKDDLLQLVSDVVCAVLAVTHCIYAIKDNYVPTEERGEGEYKDLSLEQVLEKISGLSFDSEKRMYYFDSIGVRYYLIYDKKVGYKFSTLCFEKEEIEGCPPQLDWTKKCDLIKYVPILKKWIGEKFDENELSYTTNTYIDNAPIKFYLDQNINYVYFTDRGLVKNRVKNLSYEDIATFLDVYKNDDEEVRINIWGGFIVNCNLFCETTILKEELEIIAALIKDLDVYTFERVDTFYTRLRDLDEIQEMLKENGIRGVKVSENKICFKYDCLLFENDLVLYLKQGEDFCKFKFDNHLQGEKLDIFINLAKEGNIKYSSLDNRFYYNVLGKYSDTTRVEYYKFVDFVILHNLLERKSKVVEEGIEKLTNEFIEQKVDEVIQSFEELFVFEREGNSIIRLHKGWFRHVEDKEFGRVVIDEKSGRITSSFIEEALASNNENIAYLINQSNYFVKATKENFDFLLKEVILLTVAVEHLR